MMTFFSLLKAYPRYLVFGFLHYFFTFVGQTFFVSLFVAGMTAERGWQTNDLALIYSSVTLCSALLLPFIGRLIDQYKVRYVSTVTALVLITGCLILGLGYAWVLLPIGLLAVRMGGQGVLELTGSTTIGRYFTNNRGKALALAIVGISTAEVILPPVATTLIATYGYRSVWLLTGALVAVIFLPAIWLLVNKNDPFQRADTVAQEQRTPSTINSWTRGEVIQDRRFQLIIPSILFLPFFFTGFVFNQADIATLRQYSTTLMALGISIYGLTRTIMIFSAGFIIDRFGAARLLPFILIPVGVGVAVFTLFTGGWTIIFLFSVASISGGMITVVAPALWADRYGPRHLGSIKSVVRLLVVLSSAAAPILFSWGISLGLEQWLLIMLAYLAVCIALAIWERQL